MTLLVPLRVIMLNLGISTIHRHSLVKGGAEADLLVKRENFPKKGGVGEASREKGTN
jgi:hypothetical protein